MYANGTKMAQIGVSTSEGVVNGEERRSRRRGFHRSGAGNGDHQHAEYVQLRLRRAGADREIFSADALTALHEAPSSSLREIDRIATAALREAARRKKKLVERDVMVRIVGDLSPGDP